MSSTRRSQQTVIIATGGAPGHEVRDLLTSWTASEMSGQCLWVTPEDIERRDASPARIAATLIDDGEQHRVDLFEALSVRALSDVRVLVAQLVDGEADHDATLPETGRYVAAAVDQVLPRYSGGDEAHAGPRLHLVNVIIPVSGAHGLDSSALIPGWNVNIVVSPEDRPDLDRSTVYVRKETNFTGHAATALAAIGGLLVGMETGAVDHLDTDSSAQQHELRLVRLSVRSVIGSDVIDGLIGDTLDLGHAGPQGPGSIVTDYRMASDPDTIASFAAQYVLAREEWQRPTAPPMVSPARSNRGFFAALGQALAFNGRMWGVMGGWILTRLRLAAERRATRIIVGEDAGIDITIGASSAASIVEGAELELRRYERNAELAKQSYSPRLVHMNANGWTILRTIGLGLVDGGELPKDFPEPRTSGTREVLPPTKMVPAPGTFWVTLDGSQIGALEVRLARAYKLHLEELVITREEAVAESAAALEEAETVVTATQEKLDAFEEKLDELALREEDEPNPEQEKRHKRRLRALQAAFDEAERRAAVASATLEQCVVERDATVIERDSFSRWLRTSTSFMKGIAEGPVARGDELDAQEADDEALATQPPPRKALLRRELIVRVVWVIALVLWAIVVTIMCWVGIDAGDATEDILERVGIATGVAFLVITLANHAFYRAVQTYTRRLEELIAQTKSATSRRAHRATQRAYLSRQELALADWGQILAVFTHQPWTPQAPRVPEFPDEVIEALPAALGVAGLAEGARLPFHTTAAAATTVYTAGWLGKAMDTTMATFDASEVGARTGFSAVDSDTSDSPNGARGRFAEYLDDPTSRIPATDRAVAKLRGAINDGKVTIPARTVQRRGRFTDYQDVSEPHFFGAVASESINFAVDGFSPLGRLRRAHYVESAAAWLPPTANHEQDVPNLRRMPSSGSNAVRVDVSRRLSTDDLVLFGANGGGGSVDESLLEEFEFTGDATADFN